MPTPPHGQEEIEFEGVEAAGPMFLPGSSAICCFTIQKKGSLKTGGSRPRQAEFGKVMNTNVQEGLKVPHGQLWKVESTKKDSSTAAFPCSPSIPHQHGLTLIWRGNL